MGCKEKKYEISNILLLFEKVYGIMKGVII